MHSRTKLSKQQVRTAISVLALFISGTAYLSLAISTVTLLIVGVPGLFAYYFWVVTYLRNPPVASVILPVFLITIAGFQLHFIEEYKGHYSLAISRLFGFGWSEHAFVLTDLILNAGLVLAALGLYYRKPIAGFITVLFIATRFAEVALFIFPYVAPTLEPHTAGPVSGIIGGSFLAGMPSYYYPVTDHYYFPGMYTILLPVIPAAVATYQLWKHARHTQSARTPA